MNSDQRYLTISSHVDHESTEREEELVLTAKAGSHAAFGELQKMYSDRLYKRILSITRNREDAEDALQDTFLRAFRALPSFEGRAKFLSWLTRIAINSALGIIRKHRTRPEMSLAQQVIFEDDYLFLDVRDDALNPEELCRQKQRSRAIWQAIQRLDSKLRIPLHIWMSQENSINEIAGALGISSASVKSRLHRARKRLIQSPALRNHKTDFIRTGRGALNLGLRNRGQPYPNGE